MTNYSEIYGYLTNKQSKSVVSIKEEHIVKTPNNEESKVLLVYGHDHVARDAVELLCRRLRLETFVLSNVGINSDTIYSQIIEAIKDADFVIAILSHDDIGYALTDEDKNTQPRARQNVILELGIALGAIDSQRIMVVTRKGVELPSDLNGVVRFPYNDRVSECYLSIAEVFQRYGYNVDLNAIKNY